MLVAAETSSDCTKPEICSPHVLPYSCSRDSPYGLQLCAMTHLVPPSDAHPMQLKVGRAVRFAGHAAAALQPSPELPLAVEVVVREGQERPENHRLRGNGRGCLPWRTPASPPRVRLQLQWGFSMWIAAVSHGSPRAAQQRRTPDRRDDRTHHEH